MIEPIRETEKKRRYSLDELLSQVTDENRHSEADFGKAVGSEVLQTFKSAFDALGDTPSEAANLRLRADLMRHIAAVIKEKGWDQKQAAAQCGVTQPRINDLLNGKIDKFSLDALVNIHALLEQDVQLHFSYV